RDTREPYAAVIARSPGKTAGISEIIPNVARPKSLSPGPRTPLHCMLWQMRLPASHSTESRVGTPESSADLAPSQNRLWQSTDQGHKIHAARDRHTRAPPASAPCME